MHTNAPTTLTNLVGRNAVNAYIAELLLTPHFHTGDLVVVPPEGLRHYIRKAREQLRGRVGVIDHFIEKGQYLVRFAAVDDLPEFEKVIFAPNLALA